MPRLVLALALATLTLGVAACADGDPARFAADREYRLSDRSCRLEDGDVVARGTLLNRTGDAHRFGLVLQGIDTDIGIGGQMRVTSARRLAPGATWDWEARSDAEGGSVLGRLRCDLHLVTIGDPVSE